MSEPLGWTLLHFLWQGSLIALFSTGAQAALRKGSAASRYRCGCLALVLMAAAPILTFWFYSESFDALGPLVLTVSHRQSILSTILPLRPFLSWIVDGWSVGVLLLLTHRVGGLLFLRRSLRSEKIQLDDARFAELARRMGVRQTVLFVKSFALKAPATLGTLRPVVLIPAAALAGLDPLYLDALLMHELAHIRRQDFLINILQTILEMLFFFHPAVWWVSNVVRAERENCCDDLAVDICENQDLYAEALVAMADLPEELPAYALGARGGEFLLRMDRLFAPRPVQRGRSRSHVVLGGLCSLVAVILLCDQLLIGAAADRIRGPGDLSSLSASVAEIMGSYGSNSSRSFPELHDALVASAAVTKESDLALDRLVKELNRNPHPDFVTRQIVEKRSAVEPAGAEETADNTYGTSAQRQALLWQMYGHAKAAWAEDPKDAGMYARAALIIATQEEFYSGANPADRLLGIFHFSRIAQLSPEQSHRIRRTLAEHDRITTYAAELAAQALQKLAFSEGAPKLRAIVNPRDELDRLIVLATHRRDIQQRLIAVYKEWLVRGDDESKHLAVSAARSWRQSIPDPVFAKWIDQAESSALAVR